uniref:Sema domain-containing protein n=1 Tax=Ascaris lumbricoides TaxID=6252 RepID=A0A0M3I9J9_ASCLU
MNLSCIGSWTGRGKESYIAVEDEDSKQVKCGVLLQSSPAETTLYLSKDASCNSLSPNGAKVAENGFKANTNLLQLPKNRFLIQHEIRNPYQRYRIALQSMDNELAYSPNPNGFILYHIEFQIGDFIGFHCLWFRSRSDSLVEFKTTDRHDDDDGKLCSDEKAFDFSPWTAIVAKRPDAVACGFEGTYVTPKHHRDTDCYSLSIDCTRKHIMKHVAIHVSDRGQNKAICLSTLIDCTRKHIMKVTAFSCETDAIFETRRYTCLGSWTEQGYLFVYTERAYEKANVCFVTREHKGLLYMSTSGAHCERNYNFTLNSDKTIVLEKESK